MSLSSYPLETTSTITSTWFPLTTAYSAPASCSSFFREVGGSGSGTLMAYDPGYATINASYNCNPSAATVWWAQYTATLATDTAKVGIGPMICPQSWSVVQTSISDSSSTFSMCCPSGYERSDGANANAIANIVGGAAVQQYALGCVSTATPGLVVTFNRDGSTVTTTYSATSNLYALPLLGMNVGTATLTTSLPSSSASQTSVTNPSPSLSTSTQASSSLSTGAKAGIGVVAVAAVLIVCALAFFMLKRTRKRTPASELGKKENYTEQPEWQRKPELDGSGSSGRAAAAELESKSAAELYQELEAP